jgi:hypothetical protein
MSCFIEDMAEAEPSTRIIPGLHMGSMQATVDPERYDLIVSAAEEWQPPRGRGVERMHVKLSDLPWDFHSHPDELQRLVDTAGVIAEHVAAGNQVLVFCNMGMNRSGLMTALTLMHLGYSPQKAIRSIRKRHRCTLSNESFVEAIKHARRERLV